MKSLLGYRLRWNVAATAIIGTLSAGSSASAQIQVTLTPASVIGGSGSYFANPYNVGQFNAGLVFDNQAALTIPEPNQVGGDADGGYWLGKELDFTEFFVVDLGVSVPITSIELFNTHNSFFNDRSTRDFQIFGSNTIAPLISGETGAGGFDLVGGSLLTSGTLVFQNFATDPIEPQTIFPVSATPYQYLRFNVLNAEDGFLGVGLNEMKVFTSQEPAASAPEPGTIALLAFAGVPLAGVLARRRCCRREESNG